jgi:hypothetical protein
MQTKCIIALSLLVSAITGCQESTLHHNGAKGPSNNELKLSGDSTVYGLACEGCSDSVIVLLPNDGSDPVRYNIINATRNQKVLGDINTGDWVGLVLNKKDKSVADMAIDLDQLKGIWCYTVMPKWRDADSQHREQQNQISREMSDSLKRKLFVPREYGFWLKRQWEASSVGYVQESNSPFDENPVVYPPLEYFLKWHIWNGKFVLVSGNPQYDKDNKVEGYSDIRYDTCSIDYLGKDSLVLTSRKGSRSYYRKSDINEVNKKVQTVTNVKTKQTPQKKAE